MSPLTESEDLWPDRFNRMVAGELRRHRELQGLSAQQLSDACASLGHRIHRSVISNFENGRRSNFGVDELLVVAQALKVAPVFLLAPIGYRDEIELLPGDVRTTTAAAEWIAGDRQRRWPPPGKPTYRYEGWSQYHFAYFERDEILRLQRAVDDGLYEAGYINRRKEQIRDLRAELEAARAKEEVMIAEEAELAQTMPELAPRGEWQRLIEKVGERGRVRAEVMATEKDLRAAEAALRKDEEWIRPEALQERVKLLKEVRETMRSAGMTVSAVSPQLAGLLKEDGSTE